MPILECKITLSPCEVKTTAKLSLEISEITQKVQYRTITQSNTTAFLLLLEQMADRQLSPRCSGELIFTGCR